MPNESPDSANRALSEPTTTRVQVRNFFRRLARALPLVLFLVVLVWIFGHVGILHKLETIVSDTEMLWNPGPNDGEVALVTITNEDYESLFGGRSPLQAETLIGLIETIAKGGPKVICVDVDTSSRAFQSVSIPPLGPYVVWEREIQEVPENADPSNASKIEPLDVLGGRVDLDPSRNSVGLAILIEDSEDKVTRRYRRVIRTSVGDLPSLPWAVVKVFWGKEKVASLPESTNDLLIHFVPDKRHSRRINLPASRVLQLASQWPEASPFRGKIVMLGGSYGDQDRHDTPVGRLTGEEVLANVVETELSGRTFKPPSEVLLFALDLFEAFVLILIFHKFRFYKALLVSIFLGLALALMCSWFTFGDWTDIAYFLPIILGLILFEAYEHFRRTAVPRLYNEMRGKPPMTE